MTLAYWHWIVFGILLCGIEIFAPSFTVLWFGIGALLVGTLLAIWPQLPIAAQLAIWAVTTVALAIGWFRYFKPRMGDRTKAGISREAAVGQVGMVIQAATEHVRGTVRFSVPLLGAEEWPFICEQPLAAGDRCRVVDVLGNALLVQRA